MNILILGGTAFYGKKLAEKLITQGHSVTLFTRGSEEKKSVENEFRALGIQTIHGDRTEHLKFKEIFDKSPERYDVVLDNTARSEADVACAIDTLGAKTNHYILCSTAAVYPDWDRAAPYREEEVDLDFVSTAAEDDTEKKKYLANYANNKRAAEKILFSKAASLPFTILRPSIIEGPSDPVERTWYWIQRLLTGTPLLVPELPIKTMSQHVFVDDVVNFVYSVIIGVPRNKAYNVVGDDVLELRAYLKMIHSILSREEECAPISIVPIEHEAVAKKIPSFPLFFDHSLQLSNAAAKEDYNFNPTSIVDWLPLTVQWAASHCELPGDYRTLYSKEISVFSHVDMKSLGTEHGAGK